MNTRIRQLREHFKMNQEEFGAKIGVKRSTITNYEAGSRIPLDTVIASICREFNVSRAWLEEGIEPMLVEAKEDDLQIILRTMEGQSENKKKLMRILADMPDELLDKMIEYLESVAN